MVRRIRPPERETAVAVAVAAFRDDPQVRWWFPDDAAYPEAAARFFGVLLDLRVEGGEVWVADGGAAVAMWDPPGGNLLGPEEAGRRYREVVTALPDPAPARIAAIDDAVYDLAPASPHWYLGVLATAAHRRGEGLAARLLSPVIAAARRTGVPVALETSTPRNLDYYRRFGFEVRGEVRVDAAPTVWVLSAG